MANELKESLNEIRDMLSRKKEQFDRQHGKRIGRRSVRRFKNNWHKKIAPRKGYRFHSDWFNIDNQAATVLAFQYRTGANHGMPAFWGVNLIPRDLDISDTKIMRDADIYLTQAVEQVPEHTLKNFNHRADDSQKWIEAEHFKKRASSQIKDDRKVSDFTQINIDLQNGDKYYWVANRLLVKAPRLSALERLEQLIGMSFANNFTGLRAIPYDGRQRQEFGNLFTPASDQYGRNTMFDSSELAGEYNLMTQSISDPYGEYCGVTIGDINTSSLKFDVDNFNRRVIIASDNHAYTASGYIERNNERDFPQGTNGSALWAYKIAESALGNGYRVIHLVLNGTEIDKIGEPKLWRDYSTTISMDEGDLNPFELFGAKKDEPAVWAEHVNKIKLMAREMNREVKDTDLGTNLVELLEKFYTDWGMYYPNPDKHRDQLRLVGLPHGEYPTLHRFEQYLEEQLDVAEKAEIDSLRRLKAVFYDMLKVNGDLFDVSTSDNIDRISKSRQIVYNFSKLFKRSDNVAMAQLVNVLGFALSTCRERDVVIIHGAEQLNDSIREYIHHLSQNMIMQKGVRFVYAYDGITAALKDTDFNELTEADYFLFGTMSNTQCKLMEKAFGEEIPDPLKEQITSGGYDEDFRWLLRKGYRNVVFRADPVIHIDKPLLDENREDTVRGRHTGKVVVNFPGKKHEQ